MNSFTVLRLNMADKTFDYIGEDILPRYTTTTTLLDGEYGVMAGGDKFGTLFVSKFTESNPPATQKSGTSLKWRATRCRTTR